MIFSKRQHVHVLVTVLVVLTLSMGGLLSVPDMEAERSDYPREISLYLKHWDNNDYFMNSVKENPANTGPVTEVQWRYGWWDGSNVIDTPLLGDLLIGGTVDNNRAVEVWLNVRNPSWDPGNSIDATMELLHNQLVIAQTTQTLNGAIGGGSWETYWRLPFTASADGNDHHMIKKGDTMSLRLRGDGNFEVGYRNGEARLLFLADQISGEEWALRDVDGNDRWGTEFVPKYPSDSGLGIIRFHGSFLNAFTFRDVNTVRIDVRGPDKEFQFSTSVQEQEQERRAVFLYEWDYSDAFDSEGDAGIYDVTITVVDHSGNDIEYLDVLRFTISKYGVYLTFESGETGQKSESPGRSVIYRMTVYNAGLVNGDTLMFTLPSQLGGWTAQMNPDGITLDSGESAVVQLNVTIPMNEPVGNSLDVKVTATSETSEEDPEYGDAFSELWTTTRVRAAAKIQVFFREADSADDGSDFENPQSKRGNAEKGQDREFIIRVKNDSPGPDKIDLSINGVPNDWDARIIDPDTGEEVNEVSLEANREIKLHVRVRPATAQGASNRANLRIIGISDNNNSVRDTAYLNITRTLGVALSVDEFWAQRLLELKPGIPNTIEFMIENTGNEERTFIIDIDLLELSRDEWNVRITGASSITLAEGQSEVFSLDITPEDMAVNLRDGYTFILRAEDQDDDLVQYELTVIMNVETQYRLDMEIARREEKIKKAGESVDYIVRVKNSGNSEVTVTLTLEKERASWEARLDYNTAIIGIGQEKEFILTVTAPDPVDNKESCTVSVTVQVLDQPTAATSQTTRTRVEKSSSTALRDAIEEYLWMVLLLALMVIIGLVLYYHSQQSEDIDGEEYDEYDEEQYGEEGEEYSEAS